MLRLATSFCLFLTFLTGWAGPVVAERILFVGNSFTFGGGSPVRFFHPERVHDLNREGQGGTPALVKTFAQETGLDWDISLETAPGQDFVWHLAHKRAELAGTWGAVVLQDYSTLDKARPGDPAAHVRNTRALAALFRDGNASVRLWLETTWPRADQVYAPLGHWRGRTLNAMLADLARANTLAMADTGNLSGILPVGEAWMRAIDQGVADENPYDGIAFGKVALWSWDHYHASAYGYYLSALVIFGRLTGTDPRNLGMRERAAEELGFNPATTAALQRIASESLAVNSSAGVIPRERRGAAALGRSQPR